MPTYRYECKTCMFVDEVLRPIRQRNDPMKCPDCGGKMEKIFHGGSMVEIWKPLVLEHIADKPMKFTSKKVLQNYCRKHGLTSGALL